MLDETDAAAGRTANGEAMPADQDLLNVREAKDYAGRRVLVATSRPQRRSLFANVRGDIMSDAFVSDSALIPDRVRSLVWCMRLLEQEVGEDRTKTDKAARVFDTFYDVLEMWMDDLEEVGRLARKHRQSGGA